MPPCPDSELLRRLEAAELSDAQADALWPHLTECQACTDRLERMRNEDAMRRSAAAAIKEYQSGALDGGPKKRKKKRGSGDEEGEAAFAAPSVIHVGDDMTVESLAEQMDVDPSDIILELMEHNILATKNQILGLDLVRQLAEPQGIEVLAVIPQEDEIMAEEVDDPADLEPRAPVITVM
ncbi:MAG: hypothetical protein IID40_11900, partial [Planctomycetes bacterium]|nr:hypothetical protein [Planctomycetota bacterium]